MPAAVKSPPVGRLGLGLLFALLLVLIAPALAEDQLAQTVERFASAGARGRAHIGVHVVALRGGRVIYRRSATDPFIPASNEKLVTAAAALDALGEDYFFETGVYAGGPVSDGVLSGNIVLRGGGDPTIGGRYDDEDAMTIFRRWAGVLKDKGIRRVSGDVVADDSFFDRVYYDPDWPAAQAWKWYFPTTSALSINDNCVTISVRPGDSAGDPAVLSMEPDSAPVTLSNQCTTSATKQSIWFARDPDSAVITVGGYAKLKSGGYSDFATVPAPPLYAAHVFMRALQESGIAVDGGARMLRVGEVYRSAGDGPLCVRRTSLVSVLRTMLQHSHNHYAEQVFKTIGTKASVVGTWQAAEAGATAFLEKMGYSGGEFNVADGSGLSRKNRASPALLASLLMQMANGPMGQAWESLLAVPGEEGTLHNRLDGSDYAGRIRAKTGYLDGVGALSGYATCRSGLEVAFSIIVNDERNPVGSYSMRETVDTICRAIVDYAQ
jgi:D-alanyl-D-alanine carboxypeptidase/D-alanyl-D-alanine-endopeptidase (penicillin-binding protein 4)